MKLVDIIKKEIKVCKEKNYDKHKNVIEYFVSKIYDDEVYAYEIDNHDKNNIIVKIVCCDGNMENIVFKTEGESKNLLGNNKLITFIDRKNLPFMISEYNIDSDVTTFARIIDYTESPYKHEHDLVLTAQAMISEDREKDFRTDVDIDLNEGFEFKVEDTIIKANNIVDAFNQYDKYVQDNIKKEKALKK